MTGPDPRRVNNLEDLATELGLLLTRAARGTGRPRVSLAGLAKRLGLPASSKSSMHSYVTGRTLPPAEVLDAIVIALGASPVEQREWGDAWFRVAAGRQRGHREQAPLATLPSVPAEEFVGRAWVFTRLAEWLRGTDPVLLVTGEPGAGKSTLVGNLVSITNGESPAHGDIGAGFLAAAHFCRQQVTESLDAATVLRGIARRLCETVPGFADALRRSARDDESAPRQVFDKFIRQPLRLLDLPAVVVAIDGLDEAVEGGAGTRLVSTLAREVRLATPGLRLLLTSRPGRAIQHLNTARRFDLIDDEPEVGEDVRDYLDRRLTAAGVPAADVLARRIAKKGRGNFLYAKFVVDDLLARHGPVTLAGVRLPDGLAGLYREFLNREIAADEPDWRQRHRPLLGLLAEARGEGFTLEQLTVLTGLPASSVADAVTLCRPYLRGDPAHRLFHQSFRDYLRAEGEHHVYPAEANARIVEVVAGALDAEPHPFTAYATRHLLQHQPDAPVLDRALRRVPFVTARAAAAGVATLVTEAEQAAVAVGPLAGCAARMLTVLKHQSFNLRAWQPERQPGLLVQQLRYEATKLGFDDVVDLLDAQPPAPMLRVAWTSATGRTDRPDLGHNDTIATVAVSHDGRRMITGSYDHTVRVWDEHGRVLRVLRHPGPVQSVRTLPEGFLSTCEDHILYLWTENGPARRLSHADVVGTVATVPDGRLVSGCHDGIAHVWRPDGTVLHTFAHDDRVRDIVVLSDGRHVVTGSDDHTAYLWDLDTGALLATMGHGGPVTALAADGRLFTLSDGTRLTEWHLPSGTRLSEFDAPEEVRHLTVHDGHLLTASGRHVLRWDAHGQHRTVATHDDVIGSFTHVNGALVTAGRDNTARVWPAGHVLPHDDWVTSVVPAPGNQVVTGSDDRTARRWRLDDGTLVRTLDGNADSVRTVAVRGDVVVAGSDDRTVRVRRSDTGRLRHTFHHGERVRAVAVDADGQVYSGSDDGTARVWDLSSGATRHVLPHDGPVRALATAAGLVVTGSDDHRVRLWHTETGRLDDVMAGHTDVVRAVAIAPDARRVVSGSRDGTAIIWTPGEPSCVLPHGQWVRGVAITANHVMTTSTDGIVRLWQLTDGELVAALTGHRASVRDVAISADGTTAVTGSTDRTAGVWDLRRRCLRYRLHHESGVRSVQITPDGTRAVSTSDDRTARLWDLTTGTELHRVAAAHRIACCAIDPLDPTRMVLGTSSGEVLEIGTG